jgi:uncharacterized protein involved in exopolysaccharide biosynthesis
MENSSTFSEEITLKNLILLILHKKLSIFLITTACVIVSVIIALVSQPQYSTKSIFFTKVADQDGLAQYADLAMLAGVNLGASKSMDPANYLDKVLQDEQFLENILKRKWQFDKDSLFLAQIWKLKYNAKISNAQFMFEKKKVEYLRKGGYLILGKNIKTGLLTLTTTFESPQLAYEINCYILKLFQEYIRTDRKSQAKDKTRFIADRIIEVKQNLEKSENELTAFREKNAMSNAPRVATEEMRLVRNVTINQEIYLQLQKQYEMARIDELNDQPLIQIVQNPEIPYIKVKPKRKNIVIMGFILGLFTSLGLINIQQWYLRNFKHL